MSRWLFFGVNLIILSFRKLMSHELNTDLF
jgi:hypothetical protein